MGYRLHKTLPDMTTSGPMATAAGAITLQVVWLTIEVVKEPQHVFLCIISIWNKSLINTENILSGFPHYMISSKPQV